MDGNAKTDVSNRREPGMFCGEAEQPQTFISETSYVKILFYTDNFTDQVRDSFNIKLFFYVWFVESVSYTNTSVYENCHVYGKFVMYIYTTCM